MAWNLLGFFVINDRGSGIVGVSTARLVRKRMVTVLTVYIML